MGVAVSLALPVFNGELHLDEALTSILKQTYEDFEVVIVDNASTDTTPEICRRFLEADGRIRYYRLPENVGAGPNFNHSFQLSRGTYFKWCAHDDLISPNFVERCVATLEARPDAALVFGRTVCIDDAGVEIPWHESGFMPPLEADDPAARMRTAIRRSGTCFPIFGLFRADALRKTDLHRPYYGSDRALLVEIALIGKVVLVEDAVFYNRHHAQRSITMRDHAARRTWHTTTSKRWTSLESISLSANLVDISLRHGNAVARMAALGEVAKARLTPRYMAQYALDLVRLASPSAATMLSTKWNKSFRRKQHHLRIDAASTKQSCRTRDREGCPE